MPHRKKCKLLNVKRDGTILFFFAYIPDRINYLRVGNTIDFMHYTCLLSVIFSRECLQIKLYTDIDMHMQMITHYLF